MRRDAHKRHIAFVLMRIKHAPILTSLSQFSGHEVPDMSFLKEFREFAVKGNVIDLAVGVIIGAAFAKIVELLVSDIIMPLVGLVFGKLDFSNLYIVLAHKPPNVADILIELKKANVPVMAYGNFITVAL